MPEGKLICVHNGKYKKWYQSDGHQSIYIPKKNRELAEKLATKKYLVKKQEQLTNELTAIKKYLKQVEKVKEPEELFSYIDYKELLPVSLVSDENNYDFGENDAYKSNEKYSEQLSHRTSTGIMVRSKSESLIAMSLHMQNIPFRYECELKLGDMVIYPDFTIRHPITGEYYYWEHFGMIDNPAYCNNMLSKLQLYISNEIYPSMRLITTYETKKNPLDLKIVNDLIRHYFK